MDTLSTQQRSENISYNGKQLRRHWIHDSFGLDGDAIVSFEGPADVPVENMVDLDDVAANAPIFSPRMLHFIGEWHNSSLTTAVLLQHLFTGNIYQMLWERGVKDLSRRGNDLYYKNRKLSVSIATRSDTTVLMHTAVNIQTDLTPVPTAGLRELGIDSARFAADVLRQFKDDYESWRHCRTKVRPV